MQKQKEEYYLSLIDLFNRLKISLTESDIFQIKLNINLETMKLIINEVSKIIDENEKTKKLKSFANTYYSLKFEDNEKESTIWKKEDIFLLQKAVKKFPAGTKLRWEKIGEIVKNKSQQQIIQLTHFLSTQPSLKIDQDFDINSIYGTKKNSSSC